ncbi:hypothetical protein SEPCBS119000_004836 [Sporothrix epigloea]|uniref:F-box domain-containing protein n=1 Tax=Sporothrix epigloea TaxID=1892477 RepID=A0ABP0DWG6_9PEZI
MALVQADPSLVLESDRLSRLPVELLLRITHYLTTPELCAVRSCSRTLECALRHFFLLEFFRRKQFMFTEFSLQALLAIARHPLLSQSLRHVSFGVEDYSLANLSSPVTEEQAVNLMMATAQQKTLLANGRALRLLAEAFSLLPNLETVQLRDFPSRTRFRDGPFEAWRSYGLCTARAQLGVESRMLLGKTDDPDFSSRAFVLLMAALAQSNARPANIEVLMHAKVTGLKNFAFDLAPVPRPGLLGVSPENGADVDILPILAGLRRLHLKLQFIFHPHGRGPLATDDPPLTARSQQAAVECLPLHAWLAHCPNIRWLRLNLHKEVRHYNNVFLKRLGSPLPAFYPLPEKSRASRNITMPFATHLRRLDLGHACCRRDVLLDLLSRFPALEQLSLFRFSLMYDNSTAETAQDVWHNFLNALAKGPLGTQLTHLNLNRLGTLKQLNNTYRHTQKTHTVMFEDEESASYSAVFDKSLVSWLKTLPLEVERENSSDVEEEVESDYDTYSDYMSDDLDESESDDDP